MKGWRGQFLATSVFNLRGSGDRDNPLVESDPNGNISTPEAPGTKKTVTYERERGYRRQTINEKIEEAMESEAARSVEIGVDACR